jgi:hypothetical protein
VPGPSGTVSSSGNFRYGTTEATMNKAMEYCYYADECQRLAQQTQDAPIKDGFLALANYWLRLFEKSNVKPQKKKPNQKLI